MTTRPIVVRGVVAPRTGSAADDRDVVRRVLAHGDDPAYVMAMAGWSVAAPISVRGTLSDQHGGGIVITYAVRAPLPCPMPALVTDTSTLLRDPEFALARGEVAERKQRLAAYAVVISERGLLLTQYSDRTSAPGRWGLPGGGVDDGESAQAAAEREVWEETGQHIVLGGLRAVTTTRWVGRSPSGLAEDFHAVRVIFDATCPAPTDAVVHDVDGTTLDAAWVPLADLASVDLTAAAQEALRSVGAPL